MGTWGYKLYDDDFACDIRNAFKDVYSFGFRGEDLIKVLEEEQLEGAEPGPTAEYVTFWLVMADCMVRKGWGDEKLCDKVREIVSNRWDRDVWSEVSDKEYCKRERELKKLLDRIAESTYVPPPPSSIYRETTSLVPSDILAYQHTSGLFSILRVVGHYSKFGSLSPVFEFLDYHAREIPAPEQISELNLRKDTTFFPEKYQHHSVHHNERALRAWYEGFRKSCSIPNTLSFEDFRMNREYEYYPIIQNQKQSKHVSRITKLPVQSASPRTFIPGLLASNIWRTWADIDSISRSFPEYYELWRK